MYADAIENLMKLNADQKNSLGPYLDKLRLSWAEVEAYKIRDQKKVTEIMEDYLKHNTATLMPWANYIRLLRAFGEPDGKSIRSIFKRALHSIKDNKLQLADLWLEWEKKFGSLSTLEACIKQHKKLVSA